VSRDAGAPADPEEDRAAPLGDVLGPLPVWAVAAVGAASGSTWLARTVDVGPRVAPALLVCAVVAAALTAVTARGRWAAAGPQARSVPAGTAVGVLVTVTVVVVVAGAAAVRVATADLGLLPALADRGGSVELAATVAHEPRPVADGWHVLVRVHEVDGRPTRERAAFVLPDPGATPDGMPPPALGQPLRLTGSARPLPAGGYGRWLADQHAAVVLDPARVALDGRPGPASAVSEHVRQRLRATAVARQDERVGGLLVGFVTGDTRLQPDDDREAMRRSGLTHLTAVSGTHVAVLVAGLLALAVPLRLGAAGRRWVLLVGLLAFAFLTRFQPSVLRAGTVGAVALLAGVRGVPRDARHVLAGAVLLLVLVDPLLANSLGLLLSATAAAGVVVLAPVVRARCHRLPPRVADLLSVTVGAQLAVLPLLLVSFGEVPLASVPANLVAVPAAVVAVGAAFVAATVAVVAPPFGEVLFMLAGLPARVVLWSAHRFADVGFVATTSRPARVVALLLGALWLLLPARAPWLRRATAAVTVAAVVVAGTPAALGRLPPSGFGVTAIDVGQGDAFLLETPAARVLVDAGEDDAAARWLRDHGRRRLDLVVVTHPHRDHVGGAPQVLRTTDVAAVWFRPMPTELPAVAELLQVAAERDIPVRGPVAGDTATVGDLHLEVLSPGPGRPYRWSGSELNDSSIVVLATWRDRRVLVTGDVEGVAQADLLALPGEVGRP
jgi:competence protein ComEC